MDMCSSQCLISLIQSADVIQHGRLQHFKCSFLWAWRPIPWSLVISRGCDWLVWRKCRLHNLLRIPLTSHKESAWIDICRLCFCWCRSINVKCVFSVKKDRSIQLYFNSVIRKSRIYVYGIWPYKVLSIIMISRVKSLEGKMIGTTWVMHWGRVTHICVSNLTIIGSDNGLSPGRRQAIIWTNAGILLIGPLEINFSEISIENNTFSFNKMHLKMSSAKWRLFRLGLNELKTIIKTKNIMYQNIDPAFAGISILNPIFHITILFQACSHCLSDKRPFASRCRLNNAQFAWGQIQLILEFTT